MDVSVLHFLKRKKRKEEKKEKKLINKELVSEIQPQGGIHFKELYVQGGDGLQTCIHVYGYQTTVSDFWLEPIMNMPNVITDDCSKPSVLKGFQCLSLFRCNSYS